MSQTCQLVKFASATLDILPYDISPPFFLLKVDGTVHSLGVTVSLHFRGIEVFGADAWEVYEVVGCGFWPAIGEKPYSASHPLQYKEGVKGVRVVGRDQEKEVPWDWAHPA